MPRSPILSREIFYEENRKNGRLRLLDFCVVNVDGLGAMVEPRNVLGAVMQDKVTAIDFHDMWNFTKISSMNEDQFYTLFGSGGQQTSLTFAE